MIKKFVPSQCSVGKNGEPATFAGDIEIRVPTNIELWELFEELGLEISDDGKTSLASGVSKMKQLARMAKATLPFYHSVNLKNVVTSEELKTVEALLFDRDAQGVIAEVAGIIFSGMGPSKNSAP